MAYKKSNFQTFRYDAGTVIEFRCFTMGTRYGFRHGCEVFDGEGNSIMETSLPFYGREKEDFTYQSILRVTADEMEDMREELHAWIEALKGGI